MVGYWRILGSRRLALCLTAVALFLPFQAAFADRYKVVVSDLPPQYLNDARSYVLNLRLNLSLQLPSGEWGIAPPARGTGSSQPGGDLPISDPTATAIDPSIPPSGVGRPQVDIDTLLDPAPPPPSQEFIDRMRTIYGETDPTIVAAVWRLFLSEDPKLTLPERCGNAVFAYSLLTGRPLGEGSLLDINPKATRGTTISLAGLTLRSTPWGPTIDVLTEGTVVNFLPPTEDGWYHVDSPRGWVCGLWVKAQ